MKKGTSKGLLLLLFTILYNYLFWNETLGINLMLFTVAIIALIFYLYEDVRGKGAARWVAVGGLLGAVATVIFGSQLAKIATIVSIALLNGYAIFPAAKSIISASFAMGTALCGGFMVGLGKYGEVDRRFEEPPTEEMPKPRRPWGRWIKLAVIPVAITFVFYVIFSIANPVFAQFAERFNTFVLDALEHLFSGWTIARVGFTLLGIYLLCTLLYHWLPEFFPPIEAKLDTAVQPHEKESSFIEWIGLSGLKDETLVGIITLVLVNILILTVNAIDISTLWFKFNYEEGMDLSSLVHVGTYWLIFSILLSMGVLMYFFRGNQNFNAGNGGLKALTYVWIAQNAIMIVSVIIRNYHYIDNHGLTYKRIGVYIFLLMTFIGLVTVVVKIASKRSNFFLWRTNSWAAYAVLVLFSFWNWDFFIAQYNVQTVAKQTLPAYEPENEYYRYRSSDKVDMVYLLSLSDKALPALLKHPQIGNPDYMVGRASLYSHLRNRYEWMEGRHAKQTWLSWSYTEHQTLKELREYFNEHPTAYKDYPALPKDTTTFGTVAPVVKDSVQ